MSDRIQVAEVKGDEFKCYCPYHDDNQASLYINLNKNLAHCFAECFGGSAVRFISEYFGVSGYKAQELILRNKVFSFVGSKAGKSWVGSSKIYEDVLEWKVDSKLPYLLDRGFDSSTIILWEIEYNDTIRHIRIPARDSKNNLLGYVYRTIDDLVPKYITPGWAKKEHLFGVHMFGKHNGYVNIVEGALDCIYMWMVGFQNTIAMLGTPKDFSENQIEILKEMEVDKIRLCMDNDFAGFQARIRYQKQLENLFSVNCIEVPKEEGKDVQDLSPEVLRRVLLNNGR